VRLEAGKRPLQHFKSDREPTTSDIGNRKPRNIKLCSPPPSNQTLAQGLLNTHTRRLAASPVNAILNYLYALLEAECRLAIAALGLDPEMGVLHMDTINRHKYRRYTDGSFGYWGVSIWPS
jgi:hypothetical protein